jgi:ADP-ribosylglycohydrolase
MIGAIIGDIVGSIYEGTPNRNTDFPFFSKRDGYTDDTVLTIAIAHAILHDQPYGDSLRYFGRKYTAGYGASFESWLRSQEPEPYNSWGNGSAMRVSPVGFAFDTIARVLEEAKKTALPTHNHPEGIKGAQAVALAIFLARNGVEKKRIKEEISARFGYDLERSLNEIRPTYYFKIACQESVPESIIAFLEANSFEEAVRNAVSLGGDADTMACVAGSIAHAFYKNIPEKHVIRAREKLPEEFLEIIDLFEAFSPHSAPTPSFSGTVLDVSGDKVTLKCSHGLLFFSPGKHIIATLKR